MAKKQYLSPQMRVDAFSCEDVITASGTYVVDGEVYEVGSFDNGWIIN